MDWSKSELQDAVRDLSRQVLTDADPWAALVEAEILSELDLLSTCTLLVEVGQAGAPVPALETLILGWPIRQTDPAPPDGVVLTGALHEAGHRGPRDATTRVVDGSLFGEKVAVPALDRAAQVVVPTKDGLYAIETADCAVQIGPGTHGEAVGTLVLDGVPGRRLESSLSDYLLRVDIGIAALQLGLARGALRMTARYVGEREQFGKKIGTFQAVSQRAADAWIDTQAMALTLWQAAWRVQEGLPAEREVAIARYQAAEGCHRVVAAAQHLHGGMGFDKDYPLYRHFLLAKHWELQSGGGAAQRARLGDLLAAEAG